MSNAIQNLLRDTPPPMILDMGLGSREQGFPVHDSKPVAPIATAPAEFAGPPPA